MKMHTDNKSFIEALKDSIVKLKEMDYANSVIIYMNASDLLELDMKDYDDYAYFFGMSALERGQAFILQEDSDLKKWAYDFAKENPDMVLRGEKSKLAELGGK